MADDSTSAPPIATAILSYFLDDPQRFDTLEGVARWRIQQQTITLTVEVVDEALRWLVSAGYLIRERIAGAPVFKLNHSKTFEARRFVQSQGRSTLREVTRTKANDLPTLSPLMQKAIAWLHSMLQRYHRLTDPKSAAIVTGDPAATEPIASLYASLEDGDAGEPLAVMASTLSLTKLEFEALVLCLAPELDPQYQSVFGMLQDQAGKRTATLGLVCAILGEAAVVRKALAIDGGLTRWQLLDSGAVLPAADEPVRVDPAVAAWLLGNDRALLTDPRIAPALVTPSARGAELPGGVSTGAQDATLASILTTTDEHASWVILSGRDVEGWRTLIDFAARRAECPVAQVSAHALATVDPSAAADLVTRLARAIVLTGAMPVLDAGDHTATSASLVHAGSLLTQLTDFDTSGVVIARDLARVVTILPEGCRVLRRDGPDQTAHAGVFSSLASRAGMYLTWEDAERLAASFPSSVIAEAAVRLAVLNGAPQEPLSEQPAAIAAACRRLTAPELPRFAERIRPVFRLDDVVMPPAERAQFEEIVSHVRYAPEVLDRWGFGEQLPYGRGIGVLVSGPSGVGKTMVALATAWELRTDAYVVDLSRVVSKYIGESEKHLDSVFAEAERAGAVLVFDEADALFGKRSEIKDAHDRYANIEVAYLLQRIEAFGGLAILTTNLRQNLDQAFLRRLRFVIELRRPDAAAREAIWRHCFPASAPMADDVNLRVLARMLDITGGNIRQITLRAAFSAAREAAPAITMQHIVAATRAELLKAGMPGAERELAELEASTLRAAARVA
jgi:AAA+ superfamily predicted ATPase